MFSWTQTSAGMRFRSVGLQRLEDEGGDFEIADPAAVDDLLDLHVAVAGRAPDAIGFGLLPPQQIEVGRTRPRRRPARRAGLPGAGRRGLTRCWRCRRCRDDQQDRGACRDGPADHLKHRPRSYTWRAPSVARAMGARQPLT